MPFTADTLLQFVTLVTWTCIRDTTFSQRNILFDRFFTSTAIFQSIISCACITFCPGLFEILQSATPPSIEWFKNLPTYDSLGDWFLCWAIYALVLQKPGHRDKLYIGSGTSSFDGVVVRLNQYDDLTMLPSRVEAAIDDGYVIVHKGLLCWISLPPPTLVPIYRLLFVALEATFAYMFWAMHATKGDYGMSHICLWDRKTLPWDGLCSHPALGEGIRGQFDLSPEELIAYAADRARKKTQLNQDWHYKQMAENYDEYITAAHERVTKSRANNPGRDIEVEARRREKYLENKTHHCDVCNLSFTSSNWLNKHLKTAKHARKATSSNTRIHANIITDNPETVSTDYDEADKLYFENINLETVLDIYQLEAASGVIISMGGQTPNNIALPLHRLNVKILGTSPEMIDSAENRYKFSRMLDRIGVDQPAWKELTSIDEAFEFCEKVKYPVLVRPSYVLSGAAMNTVYSKDDLENYLNQAVDVSRDHPVVITKYIEDAKEIEMDAVAKDGVMTGHFISEHVENAGVHSGDATLICPPQDLQPETIARIEEATRKIGNALNVTGPFNIQFIAKDNEIKVIECNVRASRSTPFVSKVMGLDLIEMATKVIMDRPVTPYPPINLPADYVGVKAPQFSFSRLSGADPVLGVEMASTGEVACFGRDRFEAYIKATISTGFKLPEKNVLLSIGSFKDKMEMLPSVRKLHELGYNLFATAGTADFLEEHGIKVKYLEVLGSDEKDQKSEYSLTQHLANNKIDLYINLPSSNRFRRPANYMSKGYRTRRMAVDYQTPLITNVKIAKILIEALARHYDLKVRNLDFQTSHQTAVLPGLINVAAFVPGVAQKGSHDFSDLTKASVAAGFSMIRVMPVGIDSSITDARSLKVAQSNAEAGSYCDFNYSVAATDSNSEQIVHVKGEVGSLFIPFNHLSGNINKVATVTAHFGTWPTYKPIVTDAKTTDLASILLLASLHDRKVHVMNVTSKDDISLIALSKEKGLKVTCDVSIYSLFLSQVDYPDCSALPSVTDQKALWDHLPIIDVFSIGSIPYQVAGENAVPTVGIADALPLLLTAVAEGKMTMEDVTKRLHDNPKAIFELHDQSNASIEIDIDRPYVLQAGPVWSPFVGRTLRGAVSRVVFQGKTVCLDGELSLKEPRGADMSSHLLSPTSPVVGPTSPVLRAQTEAPFDRRGSLLEVAANRRVSMTARSRPITRARNMDEVLEETSGPVLPTAPFRQPAAPSTISPALRSLLASSPFKNRHVLSVRQYTRQDLHVLFTVAQEMRLGVQRQGILPILESKVLCTMFFEPSTRTSASFDAAMQRLGGRTIAINTDHSSTQKGETLQDSIRTLGCYGDAVVLRHPDNESAATAAKYSPVPIINGGNGSREHPTQAFLDLFTIREELGTVTGLTVTFTGDLKYGRTVHSLVKLLQYYEVRINLVAPKGLALPEEVREQIVASGQLAVESETLTPEIIAKSDVLYCTRVQKERFPSVEEYERLKDSLIVDNSVLKHAKSTMVVMHPLPRNREISEEVDFDQRAAYFRQMRYGLYTRMALLALVLA
ncbi:Carbamoyl-phosphate synthase [Exophiala xenobiotica]|nr:Carbamoyl-phosphate synthase [Exophiala xenobiotica]